MKIRAFIHGRLGVGDFGVSSLEEANAKYGSNRAQQPRFDDSKEWVLPQWRPVRDALDAGKTEEALEAAMKVDKGEKVWMQVVARLVEALIDAGDVDKAIETARYEGLR